MAQRTHLPPIQFGGWFWYSPNNHPQSQHQDCSTENMTTPVLRRTQKLLTAFSVDDEGGPAATPVELPPVIERPVRGLQGSFLWMELI